MAKFFPNYDKFPVVEVAQNDGESWIGWNDICAGIKQYAGQKNAKIIALECYPGLLDVKIIAQLQQGLEGKFYFTKDFMLAEDKIDELVYPDVTDDQIFGYLTRLKLLDFF